MLKRLTVHGYTINAISICNYQYNFEEFDPDDLDYKKPPIPPLATINPYIDSKDDILDVEAEVWGEGADSKWKAYQ